MSRARAFDVTVESGNVLSFNEAHTMVESGGVLTIVGLDGGTLAAFAPGSWKAVLWRDAKVECHEIGKPPAADCTKGATA